MDRIELIKLVERIVSATDTEEELVELRAKLMNNVADPNIIDYIYEKQYEDLTPDQVVDKALSYRTLYL